MANTSTDNRPLDSDDRLVEMGVFSSPHGIRGQVKLRSFTAIPEDITSYGPLRDKHGNSYAITITGKAGDMLIASVEGISDRNAAEKLRNITIYIPRSALPEPEKGEYYHNDLIGMQVITTDGTLFGHITAVDNFGAGNLVSIALAEGGEEYFPFNPTVFPQVDVALKRAVIDPPHILVGDKEDKT